MCSHFNRTSLKWVLRSIKMTCKATGLWRSRVTTLPRFASTVEAVTACECQERRVLHAVRLWTRPPLLRSCRRVEKSRVTRLQDLIARSAWFGSAEGRVHQSRFVRTDMNQFVWRTAAPSISVSVTSEFEKRREELLSHRGICYGSWCSSRGYYHKFSGKFMIDSIYCYGRAI